MGSHRRRVQGGGAVPHRRAGVVRCRAGHGAEETETQGFGNLPSHPITNHSALPGHPSLFHASRVHARSSLFHTDPTPHPIPANLPARWCYQQSASTHGARSFTRHTPQSAPSPLPPIHTSSSPASLTVLSIHETASLSLSSVAKRCSRLGLLSTVLLRKGARAGSVTCRGSRVGQGGRRQGNKCGCGGMPDETSWPGHQATI